MIISLESVYNNQYDILCRGLSQEELVKKMGSMRTYFGKEVGKERNSKMSGAGRKDVYTSKWPFYSSLEFLKDNITPRRTTSNIDIPDDVGHLSIRHRNIFHILELFQNVFHFFLILHQFSHEIVLS